MSAYSLGAACPDPKETKRQDRTGPVTWACRLADIIIPAVPLRRWNSGDELPVTNQSISARVYQHLPPS